jgi:3-dehydroquinate synthase
MFDSRIEFGNCATEVVVRPGALDEVGQLLAALVPVAKVSLVTDRTVGDLYAGRVVSSLGAAGFDVEAHTIEPGEASKTLDCAAGLFDALARRQLGRDGVILALGGGVVSDLAGFVAATWLRGVRFAICPTTLEADVDASIGGKTAVNIDAGKNLVGAFHQPVLVAVDPVCLTTLAPRDVRAGLAESIKHALLFSEAFLSWHEEHGEAILALESETTTELIRRNIRFKAEVVREDALEQTGRRMRLNLGHTVGHAIESCCGSVYRHGECVALGMRAACRLSHSLGLLNKPDVDRVETLLDRFGLPTVLAEPVDWRRVIARLRNDKKVRGGKARLVLLEGIAKPVIRVDVAEKALRRAYESLLR